MTLSEIVLTSTIVIILLISTIFFIRISKTISKMKRALDEYKDKNHKLEEDMDNMIHENNALKEVYRELAIRSQFELETKRREDAERRLEELTTIQKQVRDNPIVVSTISDEEKEILQAKVDEQIRLKEEAESKRYEAELRAQESENARLKLEAENKEKLLQAEKEKSELEAYAKSLEEAKARMEKELDKELDDDIEEEKDDSELSDEEEEKKIQSLIEEYQKKFKAEWEAEMIRKFPELMKKHLGRKMFAERVLSLESAQKENYTELKNMVMRYNITKNRITKYFDTFYSGSRIICKIAIIGKTIKLYLALDPNKYVESKFPHKDVSDKKRHANTPFVMKISSPLSLRRAEKLLEDLFAINKIDQKENYKRKDYVRSIQVTYYNNKSKN